MSESQLPEDCRSRIQQGFAASLLLTSLLFFWILLVSNEPPRGGEGLYRGWGACRPSSWRQVPLSPNQLAAGPRPPVILQIDPCRQVLGRQGTCRPSSWRQGAIF